MVGDTGPEPTFLTPDNHKDLRNATQERGAESGAVSPDSGWGGRRGQAGCSTTASGGSAGALSASTAAAAKRLRSGRPSMPMNAPHSPARAAPSHVKTGDSAKHPAQGRVWRTISSETMPGVVSAALRRLGAVLCPATSASGQGGDPQRLLCHGPRRNAPGDAESPNPCQGKAEPCRYSRRAGSGLFRRTDRALDPAIGGRPR